MYMRLGAPPRRLFLFYDIFNSKFICWKKGNLCAYIHVCAGMHASGEGSQEEKREGKARRKSGAVGIVVVVVFENLSGRNGTRPKRPYI